jgi:hypothetical protein
MKEQRNRIMNPSHPEWGAFCDMLSDCLGDVLPGYCGHDHKNAREILKRFPDIDIEASLDFFRDNGGGCDCEILFNVDPTPEVDDLDFLEFITTSANAAGIRYLRKRNGCVCTSAAMIHILPGLGYEAVPLQVSVSVNPAEPKLVGVALGADGDGVRSPTAEQSDWRGHMVVVAQSRYLLDPTLGQVRDIQDSLRVGPLVAEVSSAFLSGSEDLVVSHGNATVVYKALPDADGFKDAPDFCESRWMPLTQKILLTMVSGLGKALFAQEAVYGDCEDSEMDTVERGQTC